MAATARRRPQGPGEVMLEKVLGVTAPRGCAFACAGATGLLAFPAGCVVVILDPRENTQRHLLNTSRKTLSALAFSPNGRFLVTGEQGQCPAVRVWDVEERAQVSALRGHSQGVACVAFSPSAEFLVSVGQPQDRMVNVWDWKKGSLVASNKVSCRVMAVCFSEDSFFVTVGHRHVKFWFLESLGKQKTNETVPLVGRLGLLGDLHNDVFCDAACGRGQASGSTFCLSSSGLLCRFNQRRTLVDRIALKVPLANCLCLSEELIFCGCAAGTVRVFQASDLRFLGDLPKPHPLGVDVTQPRAPRQLDLGYPDTVALAYDASSHWLSCIYRDHSIYVWDIGDLRNVRKVWSDLFHSSIIWSVEVYPEFEEQRSCLPPGSFLTCSSDNTIRAWTLGSGSGGPVQGSAYSTTLLNIIYVDKDLQHLQDSSGVPNRVENAAPLDAKTGVRVIQVSPDGGHLASGDRGGTLRVHELQSMQEVAKVEAHDSEVLCLDYSKPETGAALLASASRDGLIHVLNVDRSYELEQTLDEHSSAVTALRFAGNGNLRLISCGTDKCLYFRDAQRLSDGFSFIRTRHVAEKTTLYDLDVDVAQEDVAVACQDRNIRIYGAASGKLRNCYKGLRGDDGFVLKVQLDPSGTFLATSCSNKSIALLDFRSGERVAKMLGHSEIVTGMRFSCDCERLISVCGDSCIFVWRLSPELTARMRQRLRELQRPHLEREKAPGALARPRRETYVTIPGGTAAPGTGEASHEEQDEASSLQTPSKEDSEPPAVLTNGRLPMWAKRLLGEAEDGDRAARWSYRPQGRWAEQMERGPIKTLPEVETPYFTPLRPQHEGSMELQPCTLELLLSQQAESPPSGLTKDIQLSEPFLDEETERALESPDTTGSSLEGLSRQRLMELPPRPPCPESFGIRQEDALTCVSLRPGMPVSCCQVEAEDSSGSTGQVEEPEETPPESSSLPQSPEQETFLKQHFETLADAREIFDGSLRDLKPPRPGEEEKAAFLNPRLSISARFLLRCQRNSRLAAAFAVRPRLRPQSPLRAQEEPPAAAEELQQPQKPLDEKLWETGEGRGFDTRTTGGVPSPQTPPDGDEEVLGPSWSGGHDGETQLAAAVVPTGSQLWAEPFTTALRRLRLCCHEMLGLYDQICIEATEQDLLQVRTALAGLFGWLEAELHSRNVPPSTTPRTHPTLHPETLVLLHTYSDSLVELVRRRLEGGSPEHL